MTAAPDRRQRLLKVMGITPWRLRTGPVATGMEAVPANDAAGTVQTACVVVLPAGASERELDLVGRALRAYGPATGRAARLEAGERGLGDIPVAKAYIVFGEAQAKALGRDLPAAVMSAAQILLVDTPAAILKDPAAKRRLWNGLRTLGPTLRGA
ncbi:MAG: hypothetical protein ACTHOL_11545 [Luteibacter jiangsuensis]